MEKILALPTQQQINWQALDLGMFCHFGLNTFFDQEWGKGEDPASAFNPTELDCRQWVSLAKKAGFKYFILTAKHHDGFCLWPTETTDYSVKSAPWKNGKGDVVRECANACKEEGMLFGLYLSPWDRHEPCYEDKEMYDDFYARQLTELLTNYGPLVEVWFDGAGSENRDYNWERIIGLVKKYQPDAMIFNMGQPTIRWVGNEEGVAPYPCWNSVENVPKNELPSESAQWLAGTPTWVPAECDVPIRKFHWFWHPNDESSLLTLDELMTIYYKSVGHGTNLLLNVAPDNRGLIPNADAKRLLEFSEEIKKQFSNPIAECSARGDILTLDLPLNQKISKIILMEDISFGERTKEYKIEGHIDGQWVTLVRGSAIGYKKIELLEEVSPTKLRLAIIESNGTPIIEKFVCY